MYSKGSDIEGIIHMKNELNKHVISHGRMQQRGANWYSSMGVTVGSSEIAAIMGFNPYSNIVNVISNKVDILMGRSKWDGGPACWWGTMFEDIISKYVSIDLGSEVIGDSICIINGSFRNSPDGFILLGMKNIGGIVPSWEIHTTADEGEPDLIQVTLVEFKCPINRIPTGSIPPYYVSQVLSGLCASPIASIGLFVDSVFRLCGLYDLGPTEEYNKKYQRVLKPGLLPMAFGIVVVFCPSTWENKKKYSSRDLSSFSSKEINDILGFIDSKVLLTHKPDPCFLDERGGDYEELSRKIYDEEWDCPDGHILLGYLSWKLFEVRYIPIGRCPTYMDNVYPKIDEVIEAANEAVRTNDSSGYLSRYGGPAVKYTKKISDDYITPSTLKDLYG